MKIEMPVFDIAWNNAEGHCIRQELVNFPNYEMAIAYAESESSKINGADNADIQHEEDEEFDLNFYPESIPADWDGSVEVSPVLRKSNGGETSYERSFDELIYSHWSVYLKKATGESMCVADMQFMDDAVKLGELLGICSNLKKGGSK